MFDCFLGSLHTVILKLAGEINFFRSFAVFLQRVANFIIRIALQKCFIGVIKFLLKSKGLPKGDLLFVRYINASFANKERTKKILSCSLLFAGVALDHIIGNACQSMFNFLL